MYVKVHRNRRVGGCSEVIVPSERTWTAVTPPQRSVSALRVIFLPVLFLPLACQAAAAEDGFRIHE